MTKNILDVYETLYVASDNIKGETLDYNRGFQDAVYLLKYGLQQYEHINLHLENRKLKRQLLITDINFDDSLFKIHELSAQIAELRKQNKILKSSSKKISASPEIPPDEFNKCQIDIEGYIAEFWVKAEQHQIDLFLPEIGRYISERLSKRRRSGSPRHKQDYNVWCMDVLRRNGIVCSGKK